MSCPLHKAPQDCFNCPYKDCQATTSNHVSPGMMEAIRAVAAQEHKKVLLCAHCGRPFIQHDANQRFCSPACRIRYYHTGGNDHKEYEEGDKVLHQFICRTCGRLVRVVEKNDRRTVYCSQYCEKRYWREQTRSKSGKHRAGNIGMSGGMSLGSLIRREARDLH